MLDAHAAINRVGMLRAYGNAIVPPLAAEVIGAYLDAEKPCGGCAEVVQYPFFNLRNLFYRLILLLSF